MIRGSRLVVDAVSVCLTPATWTGIIGANGSGKTSLLKAVSGRLPSCGGLVMVGGEELSRPERARRIGFAPEAALLPASLTAGELLTTIGERDPADLTPLAALREALEIERLKRMRISDMSAGMRQRVCIFAAFVTRTDAVILDEPFNWLDPVCTYDTKNALAGLVRDRGICLTTALHDFGTLTTYCTRGLLLADGRAVRNLERDEMEQGSRDIGGFEKRLIADLRGRRSPQANAEPAATTIG